MEGVVLGFATIVAVIGVGALVAHLGVVDLGAQQVLSRIAFFVASPALLLTTVAEADTHGVLSRSLVATAVGVVVPAAVYIGVAWWRWRRSVGERVIGALASSYVNAGNLGLPVAAYVLGDAALVAPTLLMQLLVLQPVALAVLDADVRGHRPTLRQVLVRPFTNPLTIGTLIGLLLSVTGWTLPPIVLDPIELIGAMAVPGMLLAYGIALRLGPGFGGEVPAAELALTSTLKLAVQPAGRVCRRPPRARPVRSRTARRGGLLEPADGAERLRARHPLRPIADPGARHHPRDDGRGGAAHHARGLAARLTGGNSQIGWCAEPERPPGVAIATLVRTAGIVGGIALSERGSHDPPSTRRRRHRPAGHRSDRDVGRCRRATGQVVVHGDDVVRLLTE